MHKKTSPNDGPRNFIQVEKIDSAIAAFKKAGGKEMMGKQEVPNVWFTFIGTDPEGNVISASTSLGGRRDASRQSPRRQSNHLLAGCIVSPDIS